MFTKRFIFYILVLGLCCSVSAKIGELRTAPDGFQWSAFEVDGFIGVKNVNGVAIIPPFYKEVLYYDGLFLAKNFSNVYSIYLNTGELVVPSGNIIDIEYNKKIKHSPLVLLTRTMNRWAMDNKGNILIPEDRYGYISIKRTDEDWYFQVGTTYGTHGIIDKNGKVIIPINKYQGLIRIEGKDKNLDPHYEFVIYGDTKYSGICDRNGKELIRVPYMDTHLERDENGDTIYKVRVCDAYGYLDKKGNQLKMPADTSAVAYAMTQNGKPYQWVINARGKMGIKINNKFVTPEDLDAITRSDKYLTVRKGPYSGLYDYSGNCIVPPNKYNSIILLKDNILAYKGENQAYLDYTGKEIFPPKYSCVTFIKNDNFSFWTVTNPENSLSAIFSDTNKQLTPFKYDEIGFLKDEGSGVLKGYAVFKNGLVGVCDLGGNEIIETAYTDFSVLSHKGKSIIKSMNGKKCGAFKMDGTLLIPAEIFSDIILDDKYIIATAPDRICKFNFDGKLVSDSKPNKDWDDFVNKGDEEFVKGNWKRAADYYGKAIEIVPSAALYYDRGVSHYNNEDYKKAIKDFTQCLSSNPSQSLINKSRSMIADARQLQAEKKARRQALVGNILGLALGAVATVANAYVQSTYRPAANSVASGMKRSGKYDYLLDPNYAIQQVQQQNWREYLAMTNGGQTMSYDEWFAWKAQAMAAEQSSVNDSYSTSTDGNSNITTSSTGSGGKMCRLCAGTGDCKTCEGKGFYYNTFDISKKVLCPNCHNHNGKCSSCNGTGSK